MSKEIYENPVFIKFATSLQRPVDLSQFSRIDSDTISWVNQPRYDGTHLYATIKLYIHELAKTHHFFLALSNCDHSFYETMDGITPQECIDKLNMKIKKCVTEENIKNDIWEQYGF